MVTRKPVASQPDDSAPPYPTTPTTERPSQLPPARPAPAPPAGGASPPKSTVHEEEEEEEDEWDKSDSESWEMEGDDKKAPEHIPAPLQVSRPASSQSNHDAGIPASLRVGPPGGLPAKSKESLVAPESEDPWRGTKTTPPVQLQSHNPFLRPQNTGQAIFGGESSSNAWGDTHSLPAQRTGDSLPIAELPADHVPTNPFSKMSISELPAVYSPIDSHTPLRAAESYSEKEAINPNARQDSIASTAYDPQTDLSSFDAFSSRGHGLPESSIPGTQRTWQEQQAWEQSERERRQNEAAAASERAQRAERERQAEEEWHAGEAEHAGDARIVSHDDNPNLPPRGPLGDELSGPPKPPRPQVDTSQNAFGANKSAAETPTAVMKQQRNQTYQIKKVRWFDSSSQRSRVSPILIQNANGPCPLLALVNALTLSTSINVDTALVETLRTREQVSLGLLVDAVFEELMSGRRGDAAQDLPDVTDLYSFLIKLHTGMNVNPRFVFVPDRSSMDMHPALRPQTQPGGFEETREMKLYSTFDVPLMHGWLPKRDSSAYAAFDRSAKTYEDAQNIQFYEEELEAKINSTGLSPEEQILFEDLHTIKQFLATWPTQLTEHGLSILLNHVRPGEFAILFRNDHFSTIYKEPRSQQILTLVTDAGYSTHDEIVWESLVDLNGQGTEHFSGDFRPVSHNDVPTAGPAGPRGSSLSQRPVQSLLDVDQGWTSVQGKNKKRGKTNSADLLAGGQDTGIVGSSSAAAEEPLSAATDRSRAEQEDHDLALAMQLQEEEEERHRREQDARRREQDLSQQVLTPAPAPVPAAQPNTQRNRPLVPPRQATNRPTQAGDEPPPPTYEEAHRDRRFVPPRDHPASPHAPVNSNTGRRHSAYMENASPGGTRPQMNSRNSRPSHLVDQIPSGSGTGRGGRPMNAPHGPGIVRDPNEKCAIM
jgi:hypothetical protein